MPRKYESLPHQKVIISSLISKKRSMIMAFMGSGKTSAVATWVDYAHKSGECVGKVLVIAPLHVAAHTWPAEFKKWDHTCGYKVSVIAGSQKQRLAALNVEAKVYTINYENIQWLTEHSEWPFQAVIADESTRLKNFKLGGPYGKRARALSKVAFKSEFWHNLTGSPVPKGLLDAWGQMYFVDKGLRLGSTYGTFVARWFDVIPITQNFSVVKPKINAAEEIPAAMRDVCCAIRAEDYYPLASPVTIDLPVTLPAKVMADYKKLEKDSVFNGEVIESKMQILHQLAQGALYTENNFDEIHNAKILALGSLVAELNSANLIVAYHFKHDLMRLRKAFPTGVAIGDNPQVIENWSAGKVPILFLHPQSAAHGLNLQDGGHHVAFFALTHSAEHYEQCVARIGPARQKQSGYSRATYVYRLIARNTVDEDAVNACERKCSVQEAFLKRVTL